MQKQRVVCYYRQHQCNKQLFVLFLTSLRSKVVLSSVSMAKHFDQYLCRC